jgi:hypothetical protein
VEYKGAKMARKIRGGGIIEVTGLCAAVGASDATTSFTILAGTTSVDCIVPMDGLSLMGVSLVTKVVGATTGTLSVAFLAGAGSVPITAVTAGTFIDADAALPKNYYIEGVNHAKLSHGDVLKVATVKTGTVSTGVIFEATFIFAVAP